MRTKMDNYFFFIGKYLLQLKFLVVFIQLLLIEVTECDLFEELLLIIDFDLGFRHKVYLNYWPEHEENLIGEVSVD